MNSLLYVSDIGAAHARHAAVRRDESTVTSSLATTSPPTVIEHVTALPDVAITSSRSGAPVPVNVTVQSGSETTALRVPVPSLFVVHMILFIEL